MTYIHVSHDMQASTDGEECFKCLLCTCHSPSLLDDECVPVIPPYDRRHQVLPRPYFLWRKHE